MLIKEIPGSPPTLSDEAQEMLDDLKEFPAACYEALWTANCFAQMARNGSALGRYSVVREDLSTVAVTVFTEWHRIFNPKPVPEIATITGYTPSSLYQLRREGHIPRRELNGVAVIALADIMRYRARSSDADPYDPGEPGPEHPPQLDRGSDRVSDRQKETRRGFLDSLD